MPSACLLRPPLSSFSAVPYRYIDAIISSIEARLPHRQVSMPPALPPAPPGWEVPLERRYFSHRHIFCPVAVSSSFISLSLLFSVDFHFPSSTRLSSPSTIRQSSSSEYDSIFSYEYSSISLQILSLPPPSCHAAMLADKPTAVISQEAEGHGSLP